ncbi:hypothetical protein ASF44_22725 [Pseudorhodoferax sp. Leaf274]|nr:hypothetical protein ASF44_22725 [Pseudorhodoferax sp. Leaf274]
MAAPAVIASLTAKNALAGKYHCTVSGKASGNMSGHGTDKDCRNGGNSCATWQQKCKGDTTTFKSCFGTDLDYKGKTETTGYGWRAVSKHKRASTNCRESTFGSATFDQILNGEDYSASPISDPPLLLAATCAYLNAKNFSDYHITMASAVGLYKGALGITPFKTGTRTWTADECRVHLQAMFY